MLILYHAWQSTCSQKVRLCLAEKDIEWQGRVLNLRALDQADEAFLALNPAGMVPVLEHDDLVLIESTIINEYLEDEYPEVPLMPHDAAGRARVRAWNRFIDEVPTDAIKIPSYQFNLAPGIRELSADELARIESRMANRRTADRWLRIARNPEGLGKSELNKAYADLTETLDRMQGTLERSEWLAGPDYSLADVNMAPFIDRLAGFDEFNLAAGWPSVHRWLNAVRKRPAFARADFREQRG